MSTDDTLEAPLELRVPTLVLDGEQAQQGVMSGYQTIRVVADTIVVRGHYRLPGATLTIHAREVFATDGTLDVTGLAGESFDPDQPDPALDGSPATPDGKPGAPGGNGESGGSVVLCAGAVQGKLALVANGGRGGDGQRGGNGAKPAAVKGRDGKFKSAKEPTGEYGAKVVQARGLGSYVTMATGEKGGDALSGGNAGASGRPGDGGDGGQITVCVLDAPASSILCSAEAGAPGVPAPDAVPGPPGDPGVGGRNRVYLYNLFKGGGNEDWADGKNKHIKAWKLSARAQSGKASKISGSVPEATPGDPGQSGGLDVMEESAPKSEIISRWRAEELRWLYEQSVEGLPQSEGAIAEARLRWLISVTEGATDAQITGIRALAQEALSRRAPDITVTSAALDVA